MWQRTRCAAERAAMRQPRVACFLRIAVGRRTTPCIGTTVSRLLIHIHFCLADGIPYGLDPLIRLSAHNHFLNFAGALFDYGLLMAFSDLKRALAQTVGTAGGSAGCGAPFYDDALIPERHRLFDRGLDDISTNAITPLGRP